MARRGQFSKGFVAYGVPLGYVHPQDNKLGDLYTSELNDPSLGLTEAQKQELQDRIDDLYNVIKGERDYLGTGG